MTKPDHAYYYLEELVEEWKGYSELDLLKYGADNKLTFSFQLTAEPDERIELFIFYHKFTNPIYSPSKEEPVKINKKLYFQSDVFPLIPTTIQKLIHQPDAKLELLPWCENQCEEEKCKAFPACRVGINIVRATGGEILNRELLCTKEKLLISKEEKKRFETKYKISTNTSSGLELCLDQDQLAYSNQLEVAIDTWNAIFHEKEILDASTAKQACINYIEKYHFNKKFGSTVTKKIASIVSCALANKKDWNKFRGKSKTS